MEYISRDMKFATSGTACTERCRNTSKPLGRALEATYVVKIPVAGFEKLLTFDEGLTWTMATTTLLSVRNIQATVRVICASKPRQRLLTMRRCTLKP